MPSCSLQEEIQLLHRTGRTVLDVYRFNEPALSFYREMGFTEESIRMEKRTEVHDEI